MGRAIALILLLLIAAGCGAAADDPAAAGERAFGIYCVGCHSRDPAGPSVAGPTLASVRERAAAQADPAAWLREAVLRPNAELAPGYEAGLMPANYGELLSPAQLDGLLAYMLAQEPGGG